MRRRLSYLLIGGLIALAVAIVVTKPDPPGLSDAELADIQSRASSMPQEALQAALEKWVGESQPGLPRQLDGGRNVRAATIRDLTVALNLRLGPDESAADAATVINHFDGVAADLCQEPTARLILEADAVVMLKVEKADGGHITYYRLSKDRC